MAYEIFTRKEVAEIFCIKPRTLWHWERKGWIEVAHRINGRPRYAKEEIERMASQRGDSQRYRPQRFRTETPNNE